MTRTNFIIRQKLFGLLLLSIPLFACAQDKVTIEFNQKGQIIYNMPSLVTTHTKLKFIIKGDESVYEARVTAVYVRFFNTIKALNQMSKKNYALLVKANLQGQPLAVQHLELVRAGFAQQLVAMLQKGSKYRAILQKSRPVDADIDSLQKFLDPKFTVGINTLDQPKIENLIYDSYYVNNLYSGGDKGDLSQAAECRDSIELVRDGDCCGFHFRSIKFVDFKKYHPAAFFKDSVELRLRNPIFIELGNQLHNLNLNNHYVAAGFNPQAVKKTFQESFKTLAKTDTNYKKLIAYLDLRLSGKDDSKKRDELEPFVKKNKDTIVKKISAYADKFPADLTSPQTANFLIDLVWLTRGAQLTANPLKTSPSGSAKGKLDTANLILADSIQSLADVNQRISLIENISKTNGVACCGTEDLLTRDQKLQALRKVINLSITQIKKKVDTLTKAAKSDNSVQESKEAILSDSLLYAGNLIINPTDCGWAFAPNLPNYHYMRNHDALQTLNNFDIKTQKGINERQHMDIMLVNVGPKAKFVVKTSFSDVPGDVDALSAGLGLVSIQPGQGEHGSPEFEQIVQSYIALNALFSPYQNGVITLPLLDNKDKTPDYRTVSQSIIEPTKVPQLATYTLQDTTDAKNPTYSFTYRYNKLYRFRLKAGIAYSTLERRAYTINQVTNTSSYVNSYAGLAPTFGIQIFTSRLDLQTNRILPSGVLPYFYVGYMFHDTPVNNFLLGGGFEIYSGVAVAFGVHVGKTQGLSVQQGNLVEKDHYNWGKFISINIGLEAFSALFNTTKLPNPIK